MRRVLLGLVGAAAIGSAATAAPPGGPLSEGREVDPVARDFYLAPVAAPESADAPGAGHLGDTVGGSLFLALGSAILNHFTFQLGTVPAEGNR
jgi:hypothetical protein